MLIILYLVGGFSSWKITFFFFFPEKFEAFENLILYGNLCVIFQFIQFRKSPGDVFRPRFMDTVCSIGYQKNELPSSLLGSVLSVFLLHCCEQMFPQHF